MESSFFSQPPIAWPLRQSFGGCLQQPSFCFFASCSYLWRFCDVHAIAKWPCSSASCIFVCNSYIIFRNPTSFWLGTSRLCSRRVHITQWTLWNTWNDGDGRATGRLQPTVAELTSWRGVERERERERRRGTHITIEGLRGWSCSNNPILGTQIAVIFGSFGSY